MTNNITTISTPKDDEIVITQTFNAPCERVFKIYYDPAYIPKWWGRKAHLTIVDKMNFRPGGEWRFISTTPDGKEHCFSGQYLKIIPDELVACTFEYEAMPGHGLVSRAVFEAVDGKTKMTELSAFTTKEDRDGMLNSGMGTGAKESGKRFAKLLDKLE